MSNPAAEAPVLHHVVCPGAPALKAEPGADSVGHRMAYWEWNATGRTDPPHVVVCVHGLSRQGRDFDALARGLSVHARVVCPDVVGRGRSDWLRDASGYQISTYATDMLAMLAQVHRHAPIETLDWVGTSMGGLIGMAVAGTPELPLPCSVRRLVLNDVGPAIEPVALQRIGSYLGRPARFATLEEGAAMLAGISAGFGPHTPAQWADLSRAMLRPADDGQPGWVLHYDPAIAVPFRSMTADLAREGETALWALYDRIRARTLLLRGAQSDLLTPETAARMTRRGPCAALVSFEGVGHAPTLVVPGQRTVVESFLLHSDT